MSRSSDKFFPIEGMMRAGRVKMMVLCFVVVAVVEVLDGSSRRRWDECRVKMLVLCSNCIALEVVAIVVVVGGG